MQKIDNKVYDFVNEAEKKIAGELARVDAIALANQAKVLDAFHEYNIGQRHFAQTNGYGYDDIGRDSLANVFAYAFGAESAVVSPQIVSGTHALTAALFGLLRPGDVLLSVSGEPYDTLNRTTRSKRQSQAKAPVRLPITASSMTAYRLRTANSTLTR